MYVHGFVRSNLQRARMCFSAHSGGLINYDHTHYLGGAASVTFNWGKIVVANKVTQHSTKYPTVKGAVTAIL